MGMNGGREGIGMRRELRAQGEGTMQKGFLLGLQILNLVFKLKGYKER